MYHYIDKCNKYEWKNIEFEELKCNNSMANRETRTDDNNKKICKFVAFENSFSVYNKQPNMPIVFVESIAG